MSSHWNEDAASQVGDLLDRLDVERIDHNLSWAKTFIEDAEKGGKPFKRSNFGEKIAEVHISVYEALCCVAYMAEPARRTTFQFVFLRLQGKTYLKLGTKDPLPGMVYFIFDQKNEDRRNWAFENWKNIETDSMDEEQFDWAVSGALIAAIDDVNKKDPSQPVDDSFVEIERFWLGFETVLRTLTSELILERLRNLEVRPGCPDIYNLLFRHLQFCRSEGILVVVLRVLTSLLKKSPRAFWDVIGDAKPNVVADLILASPLYTDLLRQSLDVSPSENGASSTENDVPFSTSWVVPWLQSLGRDRRYDACEVLVHTLFERLAKDSSLGEAGQAACIRAGFDALAITVETFVDQEISGTGSAHLYANSAFDLVCKHKSLLLSKLETLPSNHAAWTSFNVGLAARRVFRAAMKLDTKLFSIDFHSLRGGEKIQSSVVRDSKALWEGVVEMFESSTQRVDVAKDFLLALDPLIRLEPIRPRKKERGLSEPCKQFNERLAVAVDALCRVFSRISALDELELTSLFSNQRAFQIAVGVAMQGESDIGEASAELLKNWTGELARSQAFEQMAQLHPDQALSATLFVFDKVFKAPGNFGKQLCPWDPIRPMLQMNRDVIRGLCDNTHGVLRIKPLESKSVALLLRWWQEQWQFVSLACRNIEPWSHYISNSIMEDFCRDIMELAEALIAEDSLLASIIAKATNKPETATMQRILQQPRGNFRGLENMIRLKDKWLIEVTVRVLCKILRRLRENDLEIAEDSRVLIIDSCTQSEPGKYKRITNLSDRQRAELLQALGYVEEEIQKISLPSRAAEISKDKAKKQSSLDAWSKSGKSNRDDVLELSKSIDSPILKQLEAKKAAEAAATKAKLKQAAQPDPNRINAIKESRQREKELQRKRKEEALQKKAKIFRGGPTVAGEGSGLAGLSVSAGREHGRSEIMVNSSDEESDADADSDSDGDGLALLSTGTKKVSDPAEKARAKALRDKTLRPVKKTKLQRSAKDLRSRVAPPMDKLHAAILAWNIFHHGNDPPSGPSAHSVDTTYSSSTAYQQTFFPLLLSEAWRSFVTAKDEITSQPFGIKVASRATVDSFLEATFTMPVVQGKDRGVSEGDILLVSEAENPLLDSHVKNCLARVHRIVYKKDLIEVTYRVASRNNPLSSTLNPGVSVYGVKITNMTTIEREYAALESLQFYDLCQEIMSAEPSPILKYGEEKTDKWSKNWQLNRAQALAVMGAQDNDGFTLIQGPPGTGKTKTIVAMVGALLSEQLATQKSGVPVAPVRPITAGVPPSRAKKLLVCAPSNAAVDELVLRLKAGIKTVSGKQQNINVLRLGRSEAINASVRDVTLDELVKTRLEQEGTKDKARADRDKLHEDAGKIKEELSELRPQMEATRGQDDMAYQRLSRRFDELKKQQNSIGKQIDANKDSGNSIAREMEMRRRQVQQEILNGAHVLCATLSGSGHEMFRNLDVEFETVIIDEAAQCVELSALIPLKYGCCKCILVGDPKQLPPTVLSQSAARYGYDQSLFVRMQQNHPKKVHLLDTQYRMHPQISAFPSREFYEGQLKDGDNMLQLRQQPWHQSILGPYRFFDVQGVQERGHKGQSLVNTKELQVAMQIYDRFSKDYSEIDLERKIGIITPYKAQLNELRNRFRNKYGEGITNIIEFNTTDAFQGRECEIIIFSCVRASSTGGIGFMTDIRRMNVGLTRAKSSLWILGDSRALVQGEFWKMLIEDARQRDCYTHGDILAKFQKPLRPAGEANGSVSRLAAPDDQSMAPPERKHPASTDRVPPRTASPQAQASAPTNSDPNATVSRSGGPPVIHTSVENQTDSKKRPLEGGSQQPPAKRVSLTSPPRQQPHSYPHPVLPSPILKYKQALPKVLESNDEADATHRQSHDGQVRPETERFETSTATETASGSVSDERSGAGTTGASGSKPGVNDTESPDKFDDAVEWIDVN